MGLLDFFFGPPGLPKFAAMMIREMRRAGVTESLVYDPAGERIVCGDPGASHFVNLSNYYREYCSLPKNQRARHLAGRARMHAAGKTTFPDDFEEARGNLRPKIWARASLEKTRLQILIDGGDPSKLDIPEYEIGSHFFASLAYDLPESIASVNREQLETWGVTYYEALEIARQNLEQTESVIAKIGDGCYITQTGDSYDACRLLVPSFVDRLEVHGSRIALLASRDDLLVAGSDDIDSLRVMLKLARHAAETNPRPLPPLPLCQEDDTWVDWLPDDSHPLAEEFRNLARHFLNEEYHAQKDLLERLHEKTGVPLFVATYILNQNEAGHLVSNSVWTQGVPTLLPYADLVHFIRSEHDVAAIVPWKRAEQIIGQLLQPTDHYPPRVKVDSFPTDPELAAMKSSSPP